MLSSFHWLWVNGNLAHMSRNLCGRLLLCATVLSLPLAGLVAAEDQGIKVGAEVGAEVGVGVELELLRVLPIESPEGIGSKGIQPSGLCMVHGRLILVSDQHDQFLFEADLSGQVAQCRVAVTFQAPQRPDGVRKRLDFEAVAPCPWTRGSFLLASESVGALLRVHKSGASEWIGPDLKGPQESGGLFHHRHLGLEGFTYDQQSQTFWLLHEREPPGFAIYRWKKNDSTLQFKHSHLYASTFLQGETKRRGNELSEIAWIGKRLYVLNRRQDAIERLEPGGEGEQTVRSDFRWTFGEALTRPETAYAHRRFGMGSAFAVYKERLWVALDNNRSYLQADSSDRRARLLEFRRPLAMR